MKLSKKGLLVYFWVLNKRSLNDIGVGLFFNLVYEGVFEMMGGGAEISLRL